MLDFIINLILIGGCSYLWYSLEFTLHHKQTKKNWYKPHNKWWYIKVD